MSDPHAPAVLAAWKELRHGMRLDGLTFARRAFDAILDGVPMTIEETAAAVGATEQQAADFVDFFQRAGLMNLDGQTIVGSLGLTTQKTEYDVCINGRDLHVWCALDAVGIPAALHADAQVRVASFVDLDIHHGKLREAKPSSLRISLASPFIAQDMRQEICPSIAFHEEAGPEHPDMAWLTLEEAMELGTIIWERPKSEKTV
ncbi:MAG: organomercurial lyase [Thermoplasmatota archaeon]